MTKLELSTPGLNVMEHKVNYVLLPSQLHDPARDELYQSLCSLLRELSAQLEGLTQKNKLQEIEKLKKANNETKLNIEIHTYKLQIEQESTRHSSIGSNLLTHVQITQLQTNEKEITLKYKKEIHKINEMNLIKLKEQSKFENLRKQ